MIVSLFFVGLPPNPCPKGKGVGTAQKSFLLGVKGASPIECPEWTFIEQTNLGEALRELILAYATEWANEIFWNILPRGTSRDTFCSNGWIIFPTTNITFVLFHIRIFFKGLIFCKNIYNRCAKVLNNS